jgi:hypothetical protein
MVSQAFRLHQQPFVLIPFEDDPCSLVRLVLSVQMRAVREACADRAARSQEDVSHSIILPQLMLSGRKHNILSLSLSLSLHTSCVFISYSIQMLRGNLESLLLFL